MEEMVMAYFEILSWHYLEELRETMETSWCAVSQPGLKLGSPG